MSLVDPAKVKDEMLKAYPAKVARKRAQQIVVNKVAEDGSVEPNPGQHPHDSRNHYATRLLLRRLQGRRAGTDSRYRQYHARADRLRFLFMADSPQPNTHHRRMTEDQFMTYCFSTDMQEEEIIFGGEKKLARAVQEAYDLFHPKAIGIFSTCPVGLIGDDVHQVAAQMKEKLGINVFAFSCEGYKGVSQSAGPPYCQ